jgi:hypothetical protein
MAIASPSARPNSRLPPLLHCAGRRRHRPGSRRHRPWGVDIFPGVATSSRARRLRPWGGDVFSGAATSSRAASVHVGAPAGAKAAAILGDRVAAKAAVILGDSVAACAAEFAAAAAPTLRRAAATSSRARRLRPWRGGFVRGAAASSVGRRHRSMCRDILPSRVGSCRSAGRRESGGDPWRSRRSLRGRIRGCRRSYIAPGGGDIVPGRGDIVRGASTSSRAAATSSRERRLRPWGGDIVPGRVGLCGARTAPHLRSIPL